MRSAFSSQDCVKLLITAWAQNVLRDAHVNLREVFLSAGTCDVIGREPAGNVQ